MAEKRAPTLNAEAIDAIHTRLLARYGARWIQLWAGIKPELVKADWLAVLQYVPWSGVMRALENLPDDPPNANRFKALCLNYSGGDQRRLPAPDAPKPDLKRLAHELSRISEAQAKRKPLQWAHELRDRHRQGDSLTPAQIQAYQEALSGKALTSAGGRFSTIDPNKLPPAMRPERR